MWSSLMMMDWWVESQRLAPRTNHRGKKERWRPSAKRCGSSVHERIRMSRYKDSFWWSMLSVNESPTRNHDWWCVLQRTVFCMAFAPSLYRFLYLCHCLSSVYVKYFTLFFVFVASLKYISYLYISGSTNTFATAIAVNNCGIETLAKKKRAKKQRM